MKTGTITAASLLALWLFSRSAQAQQISIEEQDTSGTDKPIDENIANNVFSTATGFRVSSDPNVNLDAFLYMIRASEHVFPRDINNAYGIFYGGRRFFDFSDHPVITGEMKAVTLPDTFCYASGLNPGCVSTAAGAYQIIKPTWQKIRQAGEYGGYLNDFTPQNQDEAAVRLLLKSGALDSISAGDIETAVKKAAKVWASLPGADVGQNERRWQFVIDRFNERSGV